MTETIWNGLNFKFKNVKDARGYLQQHKNMSVVIRVNNEKDYKLLTKGIFKMHGMKNVKIINGLKNPRINHFKRDEGSV
tara:strand:+ start:781 stop:1017 length:237 start_codon:yes stop_codon:yes gene_type:complete